MCIRIYIFLERSKTDWPRCVNELENWKLLFIVVFNEYKWGIRRRERTKAGVWRLLRSSRARISARNIVYELVHLSQVIERSYICESERESSTGKFDSFNNHGGGFRSVRYSFFTRSPCFEDACFHSHVLLRFPIRWLFRIPRARVYPGQRENLGD